MYYVFFFRNLILGNFQNTCVRKLVSSLKIFVNGRHRVYGGEKKVKYI